MTSNNTTPDASAELDRLYADFARNSTAPLWTQTGNLMPESPAPAAVPHVWQWSELLDIARRSGELVPVGRGGERRAIGLANPGLAPTPYATPTLWCAIQWLGPRETAPEHRHAQNAFRFVIEGEGVWTVVDGDPVAMRRGDLLITPGWCFHGHHNQTDQPMAWIDGLDVPLAHDLDLGFFEFGPDAVSDASTPSVSRSERLWSHPGLTPLSAPGAREATPIAAYRWEHTDRALREQLLLQDEGHPATLEPGHAAIKYTNPTTGGDVLPTIRCEFHRLRAAAESAVRRDVGSSIWQVFSGNGQVVLGTEQRALATGDIFVVPSWVPWSLRAESDLDLFRFSDAPVVERLRYHRPSNR
ncbi:cupin domain-containing protein [Nocardia goodfellowii]|uniref:Gentisate 1,2-dioxygenase n=1 Tax=Nocardia goodfellowii TaxID=882446 RepID=A0ABS4QK97_9NOCA|nr:cupin domain-containing protein [Nocardia goodfellowii]MBP2192126.1 gentisate 1,2-dioxygenase [Nocardia goodfellowii]